MKRQKSAPPGANGKRQAVPMRKCNRSPLPGIRPARSKIQIPSRKSPFLRSDEKPPRTAKRNDRSFRHGKTCVSGASSARQTRNGFAEGRWNDGIEMHGGVRRIRTGSDPSSACAPPSKIEIPTPRHPFGRSRPESGRRIVPPTFSSGGPSTENTPDGPAKQTGRSRQKRTDRFRQKRREFIPPHGSMRANRSRRPAFPPVPFPAEASGNAIRSPGTRNRRRADRNVGRQPGFGSLPTARTLRPSMPSKAGRP